MVPIQAYGLTLDGAVSDLLIFFVLGKVVCKTIGFSWVIKSGGPSG